jgi:hypothetical protein
MPLSTFQQSPIGLHDKIIAKGFKRTPSAVVDRAKDTNSATRQIVPVNRDFHLIRGAREALDFCDLWFANESDDFTVRNLTISVKVIPKQRGGFALIHVQSLEHAESGGHLAAWIA